MQSLVSTFQIIIRPLILPAAKYCPQGDQVTILRVCKEKQSINNDFVKFQTKYSFYYQIQFSLLFFFQEFGEQSTKFKCLYPCSILFLIIFDTQMTRQSLLIFFSIL